MRLQVRNRQNTQFSSLFLVASMKSDCSSLQIEFWLLYYKCDSSLKSSVEKIIICNVEVYYQTKIVKLFS